MTDRTHPDSGRIITSGDILLHDAKTALMYEELRAAIDDGNESMTHADALAEIAAIRAENGRLAALVAAQQRATHVQQSAEIEHVAGDVSKNGVESNMAQQPATSEQQPFGWIKQSEIDSSNAFGGSINLWRRQYDCDVPVYLAQQPAPSAAAAGWWRKRANEIEAQVAMTGSPEAMRCFTDMLTLLQAATVEAPQPSPTPQADSAPSTATVEQAIRIAESLGVREYGPNTRNWSFEYSQLSRFVAAITAPQADSQPAADEATAMNRTRDLAEAGRWPSDWVEAYRRGYSDRAARAPADSVTAPAGGATSKNLLQVQAWAIPDGNGGGQFSWQKQDERYWTRLTPPTQAADSVLEDAACEAIDKVLAMFPFTAQIQMFSDNGGPYLTSDGDTRFYSVNRVFAFLDEIRTTLDAARKQGGKP